MILTDYLRAEKDITWDIASSSGVTHGVIRLPEDEGFDVCNLSQLKYVVDRFKSFGITPLVVEPLPNSLHDHIKTGDEKRDESVEKFTILMKNLAAVGINTVCFNFMAHYGWTRTSTSLPERGDSLVTGFKLADFQGDGFTIDSDTLWKNYFRFVDDVLPYAERYGVRLALHPDDPPLGELSGVSRIFTSRENIVRAVDYAKSPYLGVTFCQACYHLMGENLEEAIRTLAEKIFFIHFRNVRGTKENFSETFHDNGDIDMPQAIRLYKKYCPKGAENIPIRVDHVPTLPFENGNCDGYDSLGRLFAIGYLKGILDAEGML